MSISLDRIFETGVSWQDRQHRELFEKVVLLVLAVERGGGKEEVLELVSFLDEYVVVHFHDEEQAMHSCRYPDALAHMREHTGFIEDLSRLKEELKGGITTHLVGEVRERIESWLINHTGVSDRKLGAFLLKKAVSPV
ncbi:MAG: hemerythrin family protein [Deltaproteobacteria bacterium]|nr:hemerythrin family protein [Deltaproteobacteria bacterium]